MICLGLCQLRLRLYQRGRRSCAGDFEIDLGAGKLRLGEGQSGLGLIAGGDVVARVDLQQQITVVNDGVVVDVKLSDVAGDFWGEGNGVTLGVGIIGALEIPRHQPVGDTSDDCEDYDGSQDEKRPAAPWSVVVVAVFLGSFRFGLIFAMLGAGTVLPQIIPLDRIYQRLAPSVTAE